MGARVTEVEAISAEKDTPSAAPDVCSRADPPASTFTAAPPTTFTNRAVAKAAGWEVGSQVVSMAIRLGSNLILTRLLYPEIFGLMSLLHGVLFVLALLSDVGLTQAVVASAREDRDFLDTAWTIHAIRGTGLWVASLFIAWPCAQLLNEPRMLWLLPLGNLTSLVHGLHSIKPWVMRRHMQFVPQIKLDMAANVLSTGTIIGMASMGFGISATLSGLFVQSIVGTVGSYFLPIKLPRPRFMIDPTARHEIMHFGRWIFFSSCLTAVINKGDQLLLGRLLGAAQLGIYQVALALSELPDILVGRVVSSILLPALAAVKNSAPQDFAKEYYRIRLWLDPLTFTAMGGLMGMSDWIIDLMYDDRYEAAAPMLRLLTLRVAIHVATSLCENTLFAQGQTQFGFRRNVFVSIFTLISIPIGNHFGGVQGLLWGTIVGRLTAFPALWPAAREANMLWLRREILPVPYMAFGYALGKFFVWLLPAV